MRMQKLSLSTTSSAQDHQSSFPFVRFNKSKTSCELIHRFVRTTNPIKYHPKSGGKVLNASTSHEYFEFQKVQCF